MVTVLTTDVLVAGDEVESILTAVSAARAGVKTMLIRKSGGILGGLSTRGGLAYMDITPEYQSPLFKEFLERAGVIRVALDPERAHNILSDMLEAAGVEVHSEAEYVVLTDKTGQIDVIEPYADTQLKAAVVIDATPDADIARQLGVPCIKGLGGVLGDDQDFLGVTPVFKVRGVSVEAMQAFETALRERPETRKLLDAALPHHPAGLKDEYLTRPAFSPPEMDYLDILNPVIGVYYHQWRYGSADDYDTAKCFIDGFNIALLPNGDMAFNGLVMQVADEANCFEKLLGWSAGGEIPQLLLDEMQGFERFLREEGGLKNAEVISPDELYVRQTLTLLAKDNMTAEKAIRGGVSPKKAIGTFSYWLDLRGTQLWKKYPGLKLPKPVFNVGLDVALPVIPTLSNFAFVGRSAGYSPIGQGTGRIVQHNAMLGEGIGIAAALAVLGGTDLHDVCENALPQIQEILTQRNGKRVSLEGRPTWTDDEIGACELLKVDCAVVAQLREEVTLALGLI